MPTPSSPFLSLTWTDPVTGRHGYVVIDRLIDGVAGGGTRMRAGVTLEEVERLAQTMSVKNGALRLPGGGAKGGLDIDPHDPEARALLTRFVSAMRPVLESYWATAEDMGTTQELLDSVFQEVAYQQLVSNQRRALHRAIAEWHDDQATNPPPDALLAHHWLLAGDERRALDALERAGTRAAADGAARETIRFFQQALSLADGSPP